MEEPSVSHRLSPGLWIAAGHALAALVAVCGIVVFFDGLPSFDNSVRLGYCTAGLAGFLVWRGWGPDTQAHRWLGRSLKTVLALLAAAAFFHTQPTFRGFLANEIVFPVNVFHYYLGSKYFDELGFHDLYQQTIASDLEGAGRLRSTKWVRDLQDYQKKPVTELSHFTRSERFSEARWEELKEDTAFFTSRYPPALWRIILTDRGYNPTPFWNTVGSSLTNLLDIKTGWQRRLLLALDPAVGVVAVAACLWAFGPASTWILLLLFFLAPINELRIVGGVLTYDWFYAMLLGLAFFHKKRWVLAGGAWAYAIMTRVFPLVLVFALAGAAVVSLIRTRRIDGGHVRFGVSTAAFCVLFFLLGCLNSHGVRSWIEFQTKISKHADEHKYGDKRSGLAHFFTHRLGEETTFEELEQRLRVFEEQKVFYYATAAVMLCMLGWTLRNKDGLDALLWGIPLFFILLVSSRYYASVFVFLVLLHAKEGEDRPSLGGGLFGFMVLISWLLFIGGQRNPYADYVYANMFAAIGLVLLMGSEMIRDRLAAAARPAR